MGETKKIRVTVDIDYLIERLRTKPAAYLCGTAANGLESLSDTIALLDAERELARCERDAAIAQLAEAEKDRDEFAHRLRVLSPCLDEHRAEARAKAIEEVKQAIHGERARWLSEQGPRVTEWRQGHVDGLATAYAMVEALATPPSADAPEAT